MDDNLPMFRIMTSSAFLSRARCAAFKAFSFEFSLINLHLCYCLQILNLKQTTALLCKFNREDLAYFFHSIAGPGDYNKIGKPEEFFIFAPCGYVIKGIGSHNKMDFYIRMPFMQSP